MSTGPVRGIRSAPARASRKPNRRIGWKHRPPDVPHERAHHAAVPTISMSRSTTAGIVRPERVDHDRAIGHHERALGPGRVGSVAFHDLAQHLVHRHVGSCQDELLVAPARPYLGIGGEVDLHVRVRAHDAADVTAVGDPLAVGEHRTLQRNDLAAHGAVRGDLRDHARHAQLPHRVAHVASIEHHTLPGRARPGVRSVGADERASAASSSGSTPSSKRQQRQSAIHRPGVQVADADARRSSRATVLLPAPAGPSIATITLTPPSVARSRANPGYDTVATSNPRTETPSSTGEAGDRAEHREAVIADRVDCPAHDAPGSVDAEAVLVLVGPDPEGAQGVAHDRRCGRSP